MKKLEMPLEEKVDFLWFVADILRKRTTMLRVNGLIQHSKARRMFKESFKMNSEPGVEEI